MIHIAGVSMLGAALLAGFGISGVSLQLLTVLLKGACMAVIMAVAFLVLGKKLVAMFRV